MSYHCQNPSCRTRTTKRRTFKTLCALKKHAQAENKKVKGRLSPCLIKLLEWEKNQKRCQQENLGIQGGREGPHDGEQQQPEFELPRNNDIPNRIGPELGDSEMEIAMSILEDGRRYYEELDAARMSAENEDNNNDNDNDNDDGEMMMVEDHNGSNPEQEESVVDDETFLKPHDFDEEYLFKRVGTAGNIGYGSDQVNNMSPSMKSNIALLHILKGHDLVLFKNIRQWRYDSEFIYKHKLEGAKDASYGLTERKTVVAELEEKYGLQNLRPIIKKVELPKTKVTVEIVVFPFGDQLLSLLTDPVAMQWDNLLVDPTDPFKKPQFGGEDGILDDIDTGELFVSAHKRYCEEGGQDILAPLIMFIDKSFLDQKGKLTLEPVMFTIGLFKRAYRVKAEAWRPMGYIPCIEHYAPRADAVDKLWDYHYCLRVVMAEMIAYQKLEGGIRWNLRGQNNETIKCSLKIPLHFIIGDTEGHDKLAGRKVDRSSGKSRQCRYCDIEHHNCSQPHAKFKLTKAKDIRNLRNKVRVAIENGDKAEEAEFLRKLSNWAYRYIDFGFDEVVFSDPIRGIHGATPAEVLHAINMGMQERCINCCFKMKRPRPGGKKKGATTSSDKTSATTRAKNPAKRSKVTPQQEEETGQLDTAKTDKKFNKKSTIGVFSKQQKIFIDKMCKGLHRQLRWQSDKSMPRTNFPHGITNLAKMTGNERSGVLLVLLLILCMESVHYGVKEDNVRKKGNHPKIGRHDRGYLIHVLRPHYKRKMIKSIWLLLIMEAFMKWTKIPSKNIRRLDAYLKVVMESIFDTFDRQEGMGHNTPKSHFTSHTCSDCQRCASPENYNSGPGEKNHKECIKVPGRNTQKRTETFPAQCAQHYCDNRTVDRAWKDHPGWKNDQDQARDAGDEGGEMSHEDIRENNFYGVYMTITTDHAYYGVKGKNPRNGRQKRPITNPPKWKDSGLAYDELLKAVREKVLPEIEEEEVRIYTRTMREGILFHANPSHGRKKLSKQHWAQFMMSEDEHVPGHMLCIIEIPTTPKNPIKFDDDTCIYDQGFYALAHLAKSSLCENQQPNTSWIFGTLAEPNQHIVHTIQKKSQTDPIDGRIRLCLVVLNCESISDPIIGVKDPRDDGEVVSDQTWYYFLRPYNGWGGRFHEEAMAFHDDGTGNRSSGIKIKNKERDSSGGIHVARNPNAGTSSCYEVDGTGEEEEAEQEEERRKKQIARGTIGKKRKTKTTAEECEILLEEEDGASESEDDEEEEATEEASESDDSSIEEDEHINEEDQIVIS